jgi:hypothetical protein
VSFVHPEWAARTHPFRGTYRVSVTALYVTLQNKFGWRKVKTCWFGLAKWLWPKIFAEFVGPNAGILCWEALWSIVASRDFGLETRWDYSSWFVCKRMHIHLMTFCFVPHLLNCTIISKLLCHQSITYSKTNSCNFFKMWQYDWKHSNLHVVTRIILMWKFAKKKEK